MAPRSAFGNIADVEDSVEDMRAAGLMNGKPAVLVIVFRQPGANIIDTVDRVQSALPQLKASLPAGDRRHHGAGPDHHHSGVGSRRGESA